MRPSQLLHFLAVVALGALLLVVMAPGCGRSSLELEVPLDAGVAVAACGPSTCPDGCCDAIGTCRTGHDPRACGSVGERCSDCIATGFTLCDNSRVCGRDDAACGAASCNGCCALDDNRERCLSGTEPTACGKSGAECTNCGSGGRICDGTSATCGSSSCNSANCTGCCVGDKCLPGDAPSACGTGGAQCSPCDPGQNCAAQSAGGGTCNGQSACGPANCGGCCTPTGQCVTGDDTTACGKGGVACSACDFNQICVPAGQPNELTCQVPSACGPSTCAGCCVGNQCVIATTPESCGINGNTCSPCAGGSVCNSATGQCVAAGSCNTGNCTGCCVGDICAVGTQDTACGVGGGLCGNCVNESPSRVCQTGVCQLPTCGPTTCPTGCCSGNTCVLGTQDASCGAVGGGACQDCTTTGQVCSGRTCQTKCGAGTCSTGCCQADNTCATGVGNASCGVGGGACTDCTALGSFCNGLVAPRRCNSQQTTCPATYGVCPGVPTPVPGPAHSCLASDLTLLGTKCAGGPTTSDCVAELAAVSAACSTCLSPFTVPFELRAGLWACAAASVGAPCRLSTGCAIDCTQKSCDQCTASSEDQCFNLVTGAGGQCGTSALAATACTLGALDTGQLCSQFSYTDFGQWFSAVGDRFCGKGS